MNMLKSVRNFGQVYTAINTILKAIRCYDVRQHVKRLNFSSSSSAHYCLRINAGQTTWKTLGYQDLGFYLFTTF